MPAFGDESAFPAVAVNRRTAAHSGRSQSFHPLRGEGMSYIRSTPGHLHGVVRLFFTHQYAVVAGGVNLKPRQFCSFPRVLHVESVLSQPSKAVKLSPAAGCV